MTLAYSGCRLSEALALTVDRVDLAAGLLVFESLKSAAWAFIAPCRVPPALLPENQTRRENAYALWRSTVRISTDANGESGTARKPRSRRRNDGDQPSPGCPRTRRRKSPVVEPDGVQD